MVSDDCCTEVKTILRMVLSNTNICIHIRFPNYIHTAPIIFINVFLQRIRKEAARGSFE